MQTQEGREGNENAYRKCKRRPLRWIIDRKQTAKGSTKHLISNFEFDVSSKYDSWLETRNPKSETLFEALQGFTFVFVGVEDRKQLCNYQEVLNSVSEVEQFELPTLATNGCVVRD